MTITEFLFPLRKGKRSEQVLAALYYLKHDREQKQASTTEIRKALVDAGIPQARKINISQGLNQAAPFAQRVGPHGIWEITPSGEDHVAEELALPIAQPQARHDVKDLQTLAAGVKDATVRDYIAEAIKCLKVDARRAAVVFLWAGAVHTIREMVWSTAANANAINAALKNHNPGARNFKKKGDFDYVNDAALLEITMDLSIFDKSEKKQLGHALDLRNDCGHPVKYKPGEKKVSSFIEDVTSIVFT